MLPAISLFVIVSLSALITKIATIALTHTGLSTESSKFQARSAYTGAGYTTAESEKIMSHPVRRKIIFLLMLVGNAGIVTTMSSLILAFVLPSKVSSMLYGLLIIVVGLFLLWKLVSSPVVDKWLSKIISKALKKYTQIDVKDYAAILRLADDFQISEYKVEDDSPLINKSLQKLSLREVGITVLGIQKLSGQYEGSPGGDSVIELGDTLTMYGHEEVFEQLRNKETIFT